MRMSEKDLLYHLALSWVLCCWAAAAPCQRQNEEFKIFLECSASFAFQVDISPSARGGGENFSLIPPGEPFLACFFLHVFSAKRKWTKWFISSETSAWMSEFSSSSLPLANCLIPMFFQRANVNKEWVLSFLSNASFQRSCNLRQRKSVWVENFLMFINSNFAPRRLFLRVISLLPVQEWTLGAHTITMMLEWEKIYNIHLHPKKPELHYCDFIVSLFSISSGWIMFSNYEQQAQQIDEWWWERERKKRAKWMLPKLQLLSPLVTSNIIINPATRR